MTPALADFAALLRREGIAVSPAELIEAGRALRRVDLGDRHQVRAALGCTLCKRRGQRARFDGLFDRFFAAPRGWGERSDGEGRSAEQPDGSGRREGNAAARGEAAGSGPAGKVEREREATSRGPGRQDGEPREQATPAPGF